MWRLSNEGRSKALPQTCKTNKLRMNWFPIRCTRCNTWQGSKGRWRAGRPEEADETDVIPLARPPLPPPLLDVTLDEAPIWWGWRLWWWLKWLWMSPKASDEASNPDVLLAISSAPEDNPADCSLETDWRPSEAPPDVVTFDPATFCCFCFCCCCCCCCCWSSGVGEEAEQDDDVNSDKDKSRGLSVFQSTHVKLRWNKCTSQRVFFNRSWCCGWLIVN